MKVKIKEIDEPEFLSDINVIQEAINKEPELFKEADLKQFHDKMQDLLNKAYSPLETELE